jgi:tetratricopeptide (TPR) repeat protein
MASSADLLKFPRPSSDPEGDGRALRPDRDPLQDLCGALIHLLGRQGEDLSPLPAVPFDLFALRAELAGVLQAGAQDLATKLRAELSCWLTARAQLQQLSRCRYLALPVEIAAFRDELEQAGQRGQQIVEALEALGEGRLGFSSPPRLFQQEQAEALPEVPRPSTEEAGGPPETAAALPALRAVAEPPEATSAATAAPDLAAEAESVFARAEACRLRKDHHRAVALYGEVLRQAPGHRAAHVRRGFLLLILRRPDLAVEDFTAALRSGEHDPEVWHLRGNAWALLGRLEQAVADYGHCLALDPEQTRARFNLAVAYRLLGQLPQALAEFTEVIRAQPDHDLAHYNRGLVYTALERYEQAIADFSRTIKLNPEHPDVRARLREVRQTLNQQTAPRPEPPAQASRPPENSNPAVDGVLRVDCPSCAARGAIRWDKLGRLHVCRGCSRSFRVDPRGGLVEVIRTRDDRWVDKESHAATSRRVRAARLLKRGLLPLAGLAVAVLIAFWLPSRPAPSAEDPLPRELKPRAEFFTRAWLKKDWRRLRLLVRPGEDRALYRWSVHHPPPVTAAQAGAAGREDRIEVKVLTTQDRTATVQVRIRGPAAASAEEAVEFIQFWEERAGTWFFLVPAR